MLKDTKSLGNNKAPACESRGFVHKKRLCQHFETTSKFVTLVWALTDSNRRPSACKADALNQLS